MTQKATSQSGHDQSGIYCLEAPGKGTKMKRIYHMNR